MAADTIELSFLGRQQELILREIGVTRDEVAASRSEMRQIRQSFLNLSEHFSRQERRIAELRDDIETIVNLKVDGSIAHFETRMEVYIDQRLAEFETRLDAKLDAILKAVQR